MCRQQHIRRIFRADEYDSETAPLIPLTQLGEQNHFKPVQIGRTPWPSQTDLDAIRQKAEKEGYEAGRQRAQQESEVQHQRDALAIRHLLEGLAQPFDDLNEDIGLEVASLALQIGASLAGRELALDPKLLIPVVEQAVAALPSHAREVTVLLHPEDVELLKDRLQVSLDNITLVADPRLKRGDCQVRSSTSSVDARLAARVARLCQSIPGVTLPETETGACDDAMGDQ